MNRKGVIYTLCEFDTSKSQSSNNTDNRTSEEVVLGTNIFLRLCGSTILSPKALKLMQSNPAILLVLTLTIHSETKPEQAYNVRGDLIMTRRYLHFPNQVNNALCCLYVSKGAIDVRASEINDEMKIAVEDTTRSGAKAPVSKMYLLLAKHNA